MSRQAPTASLSITFTNSETKQFSITAGSDTGERVPLAPFHVHELTANQSHPSARRPGTKAAPALARERLAKPTGRNILAAFQGLGITYTTSGPRLDRLTSTQKRILELLEIQPPWPEQDR
jgi:hypothetical protein